MKALVVYSLICTFFLKIILGSSVTYYQDASPNPALQGNPPLNL